MRWSLIPLLPLLALCLFGASCNSAGKTVAGGEGDPSLYNQTPPIPSPPVILGTYHVLCSDIVTNPVGNPPQRFDRYAAINDSTTIAITAGPATGTIMIAGVYLDPTIDDSVMLRDRGNNLWIGTSGFGPTSFNIQLLTDNSGAVQEYIVQLISTGTSGAVITSRRTYAPVADPIILAPGLKRTLVSGCSKPPPNAGDWFNMIIRVDGLCQWEQDTFEMKYWWNAAIGWNEAQTTTYDTSKNPADVEHDYIVNKPISAAQNTETEHSGGAVDRITQWFPPPGGIGPIDATRIWEGKVSSPNGIYQSYPYILRDHQSDACFTVNNAGLKVTVTAGGTWDTSTHNMTGGVSTTFDIIRLDKDQMIAKHKIDRYTYEVFTLIRDVPLGSALLTPHTTSGDNKAFTVQRIGNGLLLGSYSVGSSAGFPLAWYP